METDKALVETADKEPENNEAAKEELNKEVDKKEVLKEFYQKFQYVPTILLVVLIATFAVKAPPEYGVFVMVAVLAVVACIQGRKKKKESEQKGVGSH